MKSYFISMLLTLFISFLANADGNFKSGGIAIFRIPGNVIFSNQLVDWKKSAKAYLCLRPNSQLFSWLNISSKELDQKMDFYSYKGISKNRNFIEKVIIFEKLKQFSLKQGYELNKSWFKDIGKRKCKSMKLKTYPLAFRDILNTDHYLIDRFIEKSRSKKEIKLNIASFLGTISKKVTHETLF